MWKRPGVLLCPGASSAGSSFGSSFTLNSCFFSSLSSGLFIRGLNCACRQMNLWYQFIKMRQRLGSRLEYSSPVSTTTTATCRKGNSCPPAIWDLLYPSEDPGDEHCLQIISNLVLLHYMHLWNKHLLYSFKRKGGNLLLGMFQVIILQLFLCLQFQLENKIWLFAFSC